jgi:hypothetical protein
VGVPIGVMSAKRHGVRPVLRRFEMGCHFGAGFGSAKPRMERRTSVKAAQQRAHSKTLRDYQCRIAGPVI